MQVPPLADGQVLVRNTHLALGAARRTLMSDENVPLPLYRVGEAMYGPALGVVVASTEQGLVPGDLVRHRWGWRDHAWRPAQEFLRIDPELYPDPVAHLASGLTAYVGLVAAGRLAAGETVLVTSAVGAVGSLAGQLARLLGAGRVIGTVGSAAKARYAVEVLGYDDAVAGCARPGCRRVRRAQTVDMMSLRPELAGGAQLALDLEQVIRGAEEMRRPIQLATARPQDDDAVYFPGGHGPMEDLWADADAGRLLTAALASGRPLAVVCHAPAALVATRVRGVSPFAGYRVTAFTNEEEHAIGLADRARWLLEDALKELGVDFTRGEIWKPYTVVDRNLYTGQNPASAAVLAQRLLTALA